jgi:hypothetical protein
MNSDQPSPIKDFLYHRLYWFLTRSPLVKLTAVVSLYIACLLVFLVVYVSIGSPSRPSQIEQGPASDPIVSVTLPPTYTPPGRSVQIDLESKLDIALSDFDYVRQQVQVEDVEVIGEELVISLTRNGPISLADYFGQLDIIHSVVAQDKPDVHRVRTVDIDEQTGFVVFMEHLLDYYSDQMDYDEYRNLWLFFEP